MTTTRKNAARSQDIRGPHAPTATKPHLHLVSDKADAKEITFKKCSCGKELVGNHRTCGQCNLLDQAKIKGQELYTCIICEAALTPFDFCWHCNRLPADVKASARRAYDTKQPASTPPAAKSAVTETKMVETSAPTAKPETPKMTVIETDDATIEYRGANGNELVIVRRVLAEIEEEEHAEEAQRQMDKARKAREAEAARVAAIRAPLLETLTKKGREGLKEMGAIIVDGTPIYVDGDKYANPHFTVRVKDDAARPNGYREFNLFDKEADEELKEARIVLAKGLEMAAKARREAEAATRRAKHAPKKDEPKPGKSGGSKNGKGNKSGGKNKK